MAKCNKTFLVIHQTPAVFEQSGGAEAKTLR